MEFRRLEIEMQAATQEMLRVRRCFLLTNWAVSLLSTAGGSARRSILLMATYSSYFIFSVPDTSCVY
jgi:hypothetical protein